MAKLRFTTAREVSEALPTLADDMRSATTDEAPPVFVRRLAASPTPEDGLTFTAYALGRREAVWWACQCVRALSAAQAVEDPLLQAAEGWVRDPTEENRRQALAQGLAGDKAAATAWLALAAGWSGGSMSPNLDAPVPCLPFLTARSARTAVLVSLARVPAPERAARLKICIDAGLALMQEEPAAAR